MVHSEYIRKLDLVQPLKFSKDSIEYQILHNLNKGLYHSYIVVNTDGNTLNDRITKFAIGISYNGNFNIDEHSTFVKSDVVVIVENGLGYPTLSKLAKENYKTSAVMVANLDAFYKEGFPMMPDGIYPVYCLKNDDGKVVIAEIRHEVGRFEAIDIKEANIGKIYIKGDCYISDPSYGVDNYRNYHLKNMIPGEYNCYCTMVDTRSGRLVSELRITNSYIESGHESLDDSNYIKLTDIPIGVGTSTCGFSIRHPLTGKNQDRRLFTDPELKDIWNMIRQNKFKCCVDEELGVFSTSGNGDGVYTAFIAKDENNKIYSAKIDYMMYYNDPE